MFANAKGVDAGLVGELDLFDKVLEAFRARWPTPV